MVLVACNSTNIEKDGGIYVEVEIEGDEFYPDVAKALEQRLDICMSAKPVFSFFQEKNTIEIELPGETDIDLFREVIGANVELQILETFDNLELTEMLVVANKKIIENNYPEFSSLEKDGSASEYPLFYLLRPQITSNGVVLPGPNVGYSTIEDTARLNRLLCADFMAGVFPEDLVFKWSMVNMDGLLALVATKKPNSYEPITIEMIQESSYSENHYGDYVINVRLKPDYHATWVELTASNIGKALAIVVNNNVYSYPTVQTEIRGGRFQISGVVNRDEARALAALLSERILSEVNIKSIVYAQPL